MKKAQKRSGVFAALVPWLAAAMVLLFAGFVGLWYWANKVADIHQAVLNNDKRTIELIALLAPQRLNERNARGETPLHLAATLPHQEAVLMCLFLIEQGVNVFARVKSQEVTIFDWTISIDNPTLVQELARRGFDVNTPTEPDGPTPLALAACHNAANSIHCLVSLGADLEKISMGLAPPLHCAAASNAKDAARVLLKLGANPNSRCVRGNTPLDFAIGIGKSTELAEIIMNYGGDPNIPGFRGTTLLHDAASHFYTRKVPSQEAHQILDWCLMVSDDVDVCSEASLTPLNYICGGDDADAVVKLILSGANVNAKVKNLKTPLMMAACKSQNPDVIRALLDFGAELEARSEKGFTAVYLAAQKGNLPALRALREAGADLNAVSRKGRTPLDTALKNSVAQEVTDYLRAHGAKTGVELGFSPVEDEPDAAAKPVSN
jgi:cytohesin